MMKQRTLTRPVSLSGRGLFSGEVSKIQIRPAPENSGISFIVQGHIIPASIKYLIRDEFHTTSVASDKWKIRSVEHLMSAFAGMFIDNAYVEVQGEDIPVVASVSAQDYVKAFIRAGIREQSANVLQLAPSKMIALQNDVSRGMIEPSIEDYLTINAEIEGPSPIGKQSLTFLLDSPESYVREIAWARTLIRSDISAEINGKSVWEMARQTVPILPEDPSFSPIMCFDQGVWVVAPIQEDEPIRHKVLDVIGDLSLTGYRLRGELTITNPSHVFNTMMAAKLLETGEII